MNIKKLLLVVLIFTFILSSSSYMMIAHADSEKEKRTLDEVVNITIENNGALKSMEHAIHTKQIYVNEKVDAANRLSDNRINTLELAKMKYFLPVDAKNQLQIAKLDKTIQEDSLSLSATHSYIDALKLQESINVLESAVKRAEEQVNIAKLNYKVGVITKVDVLSAEVQLEKVKSELEQVKNNLRIKKMSLNQMMNVALQLGYTVDRVASIDDPELNEIEIVQGLEYSLELKKHQLELDSLQKLVEVTEGYYPKNTYVYQSALSNLMAKEAMLKDARTKVELGLRSLQINLDTLQQKQKVMEKQTDKVQETYQIMLHQYKAGIISYQDLANQDQLFKQTSLEELQAKLDYYKAYYEYIGMLGSR